MFGGGKGSSWGDDSWGDDSWGGDDWTEWITALVMKGKAAKGKKGSGKDSGKSGGKSYGKDSGKDFGGKGKSLKGKGKAEAKLAMGETIYSGQVKCFDPDKKHGYIVCEALQKLYGQDVYIFADILANSGAGPGDVVAFFVHWSAKGQPQASEPVIRLEGHEGEYVLRGEYKPGKDPEKFGFIDCHKTKELFGRDVYLYKELAPDLQPGQSVSFNAYLNKDGMPNVRAIEVCEPDWEPVPADLSVMKRVEIPTDAGGKSVGRMHGGGDKGGKGGKGKSSMWGALGDWGDWGEWGDWGDWGWSGSSGKGKDKGKGKGCCKGTGAGPPTPTGKLFFGTLKTFNEVGNFGFIECEEAKEQFGHDVFCHGRVMGDLKGCPIGTLLHFEVGVSAKGQPQALNITGDQSSALAAGGGDGADASEADALAEALAALDGSAPAAKRARQGSAEESEFDKLLREWA